MEEVLEQSLRDLISKRRGLNGLATHWDEELSQLLSPALTAYEVGKSGSSSCFLSSSSTPPPHHHPPRPLTSRRPRGSTEALQGSRTSNTGPDPAVSPSLYPPSPFCPPLPLIPPLNHSPGPPLRPPLSRSPLSLLPLSTTASYSPTS
eukprot:768600-Hanusia_phi.AAC.2